MTSSGSKPLSSVGPEPLALLLPLPDPGADLDCILVSPLTLILQTMQRWPLLPSDLDELFVGKLIKTEPATKPNAVRAFSVDPLFT